MTTTTPPGWYPEPGQTGNGPAMERWWDGNAWTEYTRTAPVPMAGQQPPLAPPPYAPYPAGDVISGGAPKRRTGVIVLSIVAALVVIGGVIAAVLVAGGGSSDNSADKTPAPPSATGRPHEQQQPPSDPQGPGPDQQQSPPATKGPGQAAVDSLDGISLPVLDGWTGSDSGAQSAANVVTGQYPCPGDANSSCVRGGVFAQPAQTLDLTSTTAEAAAKEDIAGNAKASYGSDIYGRTTSHQQVASGPVTVAGQKGYQVRWKVATQSGTDGYVESLVFPSPVHKGLLVVVRFGFDIGGKAPSPSVIDQITKGIKADSSTPGSSGGTGV
ncbi:DUF2510 domain-containing protein [Actinacidiphila guanduensis]|uniref:DUF2510 domain-containing protein n=1 Tax=Actinacidiphila guanduensis TaxID=310781 RepID=A0A1H0L8J3_9ACTN|nr:DUF2510 domain-containing protein [Actinacidiphila guanduensis]SDO64538.1 Protein of unknown function [Actinacidiphila guanduensis]